ncbi:MAG: hypothetical protein U1A78_32135 [Polyangia bacterium]
MADAIVRLFTALWTAIQARRMTTAAAELRRGEQLNQEMAADVAELEKRAEPMELPQ